MRSYGLTTTLFFILLIIPPLYYVVNRNRAVLDEDGKPEPIEEGTEI